MSFQYSTTVVVAGTSDYYSGGVFYLASSSSHVVVQVPVGATRLDESKEQDIDGKICSLQVGTCYRASAIDGNPICRMVEDPNASE